mmetsp:Transcript_1021/g.3179  ORF Transcript_1021/g.3179 Transcript_1021/m.3179 type:complete len:95 (+) Transcript_1021:76-360(+)|eukprot:CAMPEP_0198724364 /NCGR_PEP_ID=MMETSP1475-20131203/1845_1 /TAXON_ID= ORGANISM="Unidentified sp., Strain CCMP1999" /NCGR_SAMPLE_ID=MMETSP1475 /ASSEMBLY_ACC=CAM_ASM_001111 /LENGTH=94 /DNA_ID=CAMNT_0044485865 /DNA_START=64 /DNA_END=348 /DNA_ORIENTATION=-
MMNSVDKSKCELKASDMSDEMKEEAFNVACEAIGKYEIEKEIAAHVKKEFDKRYSPTWHCVCGRNFGSFVTHETNRFIYFYVGQMAVLLFKSGS